MDKLTFFSGCVVAVLCLCLWHFGGKISIYKISENFAIFKPMFLASAIFLMFYPANAMWLSVREAAGELKFNNWLLFITNYLVGLPVIYFILTHITGKIIYVEKSGLQFAVVSHALTFAYVITADAILEAARAFVSRIHIFKFNWIKKSPLRMMRSILDMEVDVFKAGNFAKSFSEDISELIDEKIIRAGVEGAISFMFWLSKLSELISEKKEFSVISLMPDYKISTVWRGGGEGYARVAEVVGDRGYICRVSRYFIAILLPEFSEAECKKLVAEIHFETGVYLAACSFANSVCKKIKTKAEVIKWISAPKEYESGVVKNAEWLNISARIFRLNIYSNGETGDNRLKMLIVEDPANARAIDNFCRLKRESAKEIRTGEDFRAFCKNEYLEIVENFLQKKVVWINLRDRSIASEDNIISEDMWRLIEREERRTIETGIADYRKFSRKEWRGFLPIYFCGMLIGFYKFETEDLEEQKEALLFCAACYLAN